MRCKRFRADGSPCTNETANADGWCRQSDCPGFLRRTPETAPINEGGPQGTARHIEETSDVQITGITIDDVATVVVTQHAKDSFRFHHGGDEIQAEVQLRLMLEDFLLKSAKRVSATGYVSLARDGYTMTLAPEGDAIVGYSTVHRERTWEQFKSGVKSRFKRSGKQREFSGPPPDAGPPVDLPNFWNAFDAQSVHLTGRVRRDFVKLEDLASASDDELDQALRLRCADFNSGLLTQREDGFFTVSLGGRLWLIGPDCRSLIGVKLVPAE